MRHLTHLKYIDVVAREGSIRKAAEKLNITSTALNRRILSLEEEVGTALFERLPSGVRLNTAGELFIQHIRYQMTDLSRVLSQIADLSGVRRGHVCIHASPELSSGFLPEQIAAYRLEFPSVSFDLSARKTADTLKALREFETDIALVFGDSLPSDVHIAASIEQRVHAFMQKTHPLAQQKTLRLQEKIGQPVILPQSDEGLLGLIEAGQTRSHLVLNQAISTDDFNWMLNYACREPIIGFHLPVRLLYARKLPDELAFIPIDERDMPSGLIHLVYSKGRVLPVAAAKFLDQLVQNLNLHFPDETR